MKKERPGAQSRLSRMSEHSLQNGRHLAVVDVRIHSLAEWEQLLMNDATAAPLNAENEALGALYFDHAHPTPSICFSSRRKCISC